MLWPDPHNITTAQPCSGKKFKRCCYWKQADADAGEEGGMLETFLGKVFTMLAAATDDKKKPN